MLLPPVVIAVVLHAGWNVVVRAGTDRQRKTALLVSRATVLAALILPFLPLPPIAAWRYLLTSAGLNVVHFVLITEAYTRGCAALRQC